MKLLLKLVLIALICGSMPVIKGMQEQEEQDIKHLKKELAASRSKSAQLDQERIKKVEAIRRGGSRQAGILAGGVGMLMGVTGVYGYFYAPQWDRLSTRGFAGFSAVSLALLGFSFDELGYQNGRGGWNNIYNYLFGKKRA